MIHTSNGTEEAYITFEEMLAILVNYEREFSLEECLHYRQVAKNKLKDFEYMNQFILDKIKVGLICCCLLYLVRSLKRIKMNLQDFSKRCCPE